MSPADLLPSGEISNNPWHIGRNWPVPGARANVSVTNLPARSEDVHRWPTDLTILRLVIVKDSEFSNRSAVRIGVHPVGKLQPLAQIPAGIE